MLSHSFWFLLICIFDYQTCTLFRVRLFIVCIKETNYDIKTLSTVGGSDREQLVVLYPSQCSLLCSLSEPWPGQRTKQRTQQRTKTTSSFCGLSQVVLYYLKNGLFIDMHQLYRVARIENKMFSIRARVLYWCSLSEPKFLEVFSIRASVLYPSHFPCSLSEPRYWAGSDREQFSIRAPYCSLYCYSRITITSYNIPPNSYTVSELFLYQSKMRFDLYN